MTATWTANRTWIAGELVSAAIMNQYVRDNLDWLKTPTANTPATFGTTFTTTSATFVDVTSMTATITSNGGGFDVHSTFRIRNSSTAACYFEILLDGVTVSGSSGVAYVREFVADYDIHVTIFWHIPAVAAGSHTIKLQASSPASSTLSIFGTTAALGKPQFYVVERGG